ncbi:unnamed protein product [Urochloa decumbens]|uniref:Reverse transcriptase zinc-binding domain-containing protein n=1 Tax=Urochloa decumbens TaxID=240449 RepID=A0ABC9CZW2_9POAL
MHRHGALDSPDCPFCLGVEEDLRHLFTECPRLTPFWEKVLPGRAPPSCVRDAVESIAGLLSCHSALLGHTAALGVLWIIWKSRNRKVFDGILLDTAAMLVMLFEHLKLWTCRAPRKVDTAPLVDWCQLISHVN